MRISEVFLKVSGSLQRFSDLYGSPCLSYILGVPAASTVSWMATFRWCCSLVLSYLLLLLNSLSGLFTISPCLGLLIGT